MANLRQEVTAGARAFAADPTPTCPHLSDDPFERGKQIRAVVLDEIVRGALECTEPPTVELRKFIGRPRAEIFKIFSSGVLYEACGIQIYKMTGQPGRTRDMITAYAETIGHQGSHPEEPVLMKLDSFVGSGVGFTAKCVRLASVALPDSEPEALYRKLGSSYSGMAKRFTGGKSFVKLNTSSGVIEYLPGSVKDLVLEGSEEIRFHPTIIDRAQTFVPDGAQAMAEVLGGKDRSALCTASVELTEGGESAAEAVWKWSLRSAENSSLIEVIRETETFSPF